jgi:hypothetical protein
MGRRFSMMKDGDLLEPHHLNAIYRELNRWRSLRCVAPLRAVGIEDGVSNPEISMGDVRQLSMKLTATGDSNGKHEWKGVVWNGTAYVDTGKTGNINGDWAMEINSLRCPKSDQVYRAWRNNWGVWTFEAVRTLGVTSTAINANSSGTAFLWSLFNGAYTNSNTSITAYNWSDLSAVATGKRVMLTPHAGRWLVDFEACS